MMRLELMVAAAALAMLLVSGPARACGNGECEPPPPAPPAPPPVVVTPDPDRDPLAPAPVVHFAICCAEGGQPTWRTALFRDPLQAALQCQGRALRYEERGQSLPACPFKLGVQE